MPSVTSSSFYKVQTVRKTLECLTGDETHDLMGTIRRLFIIDRKGTAVRKFRTVIRRFEGLPHRQCQSQ